MGCDCCFFFYLKTFLEIENLFAIKNNRYDKIKKYWENGSLCLLL